VSPFAVGAEGGDGVGDVPAEAVQAVLVDVRVLVLVRKVM